MLRDFKSTGVTPIFWSCLPQTCFSVSDCPFFLFLPDYVNCATELSMPPPLPTSSCSSFCLAVFHWPQKTQFEQIPFATRWELSGSQRMTHHLHFILHTFLHLLINCLNNFLIVVHIISSSDPFLFWYWFYCYLHHWDCPEGNALFACWSIKLKSNLCLSATLSVISDQSLNFSSSSLPYFLYMSLFMSPNTFICFLQFC